MKAHRPRRPNPLLLRMLQTSHADDKGLTLVEALVSLLIFFVAAASIVPVFLNYTVSTINNERRTGGIAVAQQVLDGLRQLDTTTLQATGSDTLTDVSYLGKTYTPIVTYCQNPAFCTNPDSRHITLQVFHNGDEIYQAETVFTNLQ
ncbi:type IV pilus modification PilV family protein [Acaryochloris marina NIES-2412]|uniref:type IV pilus modification PilV family protein n=1 Tax=Acaryochloris marina TaxID=155978 RepID=UPI004058AABD